MGLRMSRSPPVTVTRRLDLYIPEEFEPAFKEQLAFDKQSNRNYLSIVADISYTDWLDVEQWQRNFYIEMNLEVANFQGHGMVFWFKKRTQKRLINSRSRPRIISSLLQDSECIICAEIQKLDNSPFLHLYATQSDLPTDHLLDKTF
jgi:hypothetical protein